MLEVLGIHDHVISGLAGEIALYYSQGVYDNAQMLLWGRGVHLGRKIIWRIVKIVMCRALGDCKPLIERGDERSYSRSLAGKRIAIFVDGAA